MTAEMAKRGFNLVHRDSVGQASPIPEEDLQFEYESDSIEKYDMLSNEFDYEEVRKNESFGVKQYKDAIYRGLLAIGAGGR